MKVLHICNNYTMSTVHQEMANASRALGTQNTVFAPVLGLAGSGRVTLGEGEYAVKCVSRADRYFYYHKQEKIYQALRKTVSPEKFNLIHTHCVFSDGNNALRLKQELGIPYIVTVNNTDINAFFRLRKLLHGRGIEILREASFIVFISEAYRRSLFRKYIPEALQEELYKKTRIIPFGIDRFWLDNLRREKQPLPDGRRLRLFYAGNIDRNKNASMTLRAMELLRQKGWETTLTAAGWAADPSVLQKLLKDSAFQYAGPQPKEKLIECYRQNDIFVMPSLTETFGLVYAEALSQGLPIGYSQGQGFDGQFPEGYVGFSADPRSAESISAAIEQAAANYAALQENCTAAARKFDWNAIAAQYQALYEQMIPSKGGSQ